MHQPIKKYFENMNFAFFEPHRDFATNPTLIALTRKFLEHGAKVDLYSPDFHGYPDLDFEIERFSFPYPERFWSHSATGMLRNLKRYFFNQAWRAHTVLSNKKYDLVLGIDPDGVIAAWNYTKTNSTPFIYLSFEIFFGDEMNKHWELFHKKDEITASQQADLVIIQDKWRAELLGEENSIPQNKFVYIPVSPANTKIPKSNYLRSRFNIPDDKFIVLHSGSFDNWTYADELIESMEFWPRNAILIVHTRQNLKNKNPYFNRLKKSENERIFISTTPLVNDKYEEMVSSADIGLVLYKPIQNDKYLQKNIKVIGLSSGKFSTYMKHGLPVISSKQMCYADLLKEFKFGINMDSFTDITSAILEVTANYEAYHNEALRLFSEKLDFTIYWQNFIENVTRILNAKN
jgi:hypothetical protein